MYINEKPAMHIIFSLRISTNLYKKGQKAAISTKGRIQVQATLSAVKEMAGWTLYACLICMIFAVVIPYPKRKLLT